MKGTIIALASPDAVQYRVNVDMAPQCWDAEPFQLIAWDNPNWLNSVWLATVTQVLNLPKRVAHEVLLPLCIGDLLGALTGIFYLVTTTLAFLVLGLAGKLRVLPLAAHVIGRSRHASPEEIADDTANDRLALMKAVR